MLAYLKNKEASFSQTPTPYPTLFNIGQVRVAETFGDLSKIETSAVVHPKEHEELP
jgi:hypothetical protein